ncbi:response regulator [Paenibacillus sp. CF384]|uniref:response regulator transcription factor n=1 Tax=Paenibacillus sp. CF384 TaxID=1884382 RepID=UPI00089B1B35|nr:response regulator [Paenibacillus sp. CF384]SDW71559.1 two component transcriptional regulator, AraC family [Paenibacillus sp. CF384]
MYRVLIVDDEQTERDGLEYLIKQHSSSFQIDKARNGQEAIEQLTKKPADLLITDIKMPLMNGLELSDKAKKLYPNLLILISSAYGDFEYMHDAIKVRVDDYILKPVVVNHFIRIMENMLSTLDDRKRKEDKRRELLHDYKDAGYFKKEMLIKQLLDEEQGVRQREPEDSISEKKAIADAITFIEGHYHQEIGLEWVAKQVYLSPGYLSGLFKKETGKSIIQYITLCRLENAKKLLTETNMKINDVCQEVGYNNASYFSLIFRKYFGITPNHMRECRGKA